MMTFLRAAALTSLVLWATACGGDEGGGQSEQVLPVIIESARAEVLVGADTMLVFGPTIFAFVVGDPSDARPSAGLLAMVQDFQSGIQEAYASLESLGVRVVSVDQTPAVLGLSHDLNAAAGPTLNGLSVGYLFVDAAGHVKRVTSVQGSAGLFCTAARVFGLTLNASQSPSCPG